MFSGIHEKIPKILLKRAKNKNGEKIFKPLLLILIYFVKETKCLKNRILIEKIK